LFKKKGQIIFDSESATLPNEDKILELGLDHGLEDLQNDGEIMSITCAPENYLTLKDALITAQLNPSNSEITMIPDILVKVTADNAKKIFEMIESLEDNDDVQNVYSNIDFDEKELMEIM